MDEDQFDDAVDDATHAVISAFADFVLPEGDELSNLLYRINDAITPIMRDAVERGSSK